MKITSNFTPLWEQWTDPGPDVCGAGVRRAPFTYLAGIDGACVIELQPGEKIDLDHCKDIAQEACSFAQVEKWTWVIEDVTTHLITASYRVVLTIEEWDESTAVEQDEADEPNTDREDWDR